MGYSLFTCSSFGGSTSQTTIAPEVVAGRAFARFIEYWAGQHLAPSMSPCVMHTVSNESLKSVQWETPEGKSLVIDQTNDVLWVRVSCRLTKSCPRMSTRPSPASTTWTTTLRPQDLSLTLLPIDGSRTSKRSSGTRTVRGLRNSARLCERSESCRTCRKVLYWSLSAVYVTR